jgi:predicted GIY-YIG superfamily endonuclease
VGISPDPQKRLAKHNAGLGSKMAINQGNFALVYVSRSFDNKSLARKREIQIKGRTRLKKEMLISGKWQ